MLVDFELIERAQKGDAVAFNEIVLAYRKRILGQITRLISRPEDVEDLGWQERALCAQTDPEAFFPEKGGSTREAKRVCRSCEVRAECLEYALENDERFGIWGGLSERERRRIKRQVG